MDPLLRVASLVKETAGCPFASLLKICMGTGLLQDLAPAVSAARTQCNAHNAAIGEGPEWRCAQDRRGTAEAQQRCNRGALCSGRAWIRTFGSCRGRLCWRRSAPLGYRSARARALARRTALWRRVKRQTVGDCCECVASYAMSMRNGQVVQ